MLPSDQWYSSSHRYMTMQAESWLVTMFSEHKLSQAVNLVNRLCFYAHDDTSVAPAVTKCVYKEPKAKT